jgi:L-fucose mutarotase/ribose pyranase (RbsD/FucU family)
MLKGIDPLLNADLLYALRAMGHGDDLVIPTPISRPRPWRRAG